jgi:hypothetical protein
LHEVLALPASELDVWRAFFDWEAEEREKARKEAEANAPKKGRRR